MYKALVLLILLSFFSGKIMAGIYPQEGSKLSWRLIGFSFPVISGAEKYKIQIARGLQNNEQSFQENIFKDVNSIKNKIIAEVPDFGCQYTWRVVSTRKGNKVNSALYHFSVSISRDVDTTITRLRIITPPQKYNDCYILMDGCNAIYDMQGHPVWFLPGTESGDNKNVYSRDLKATSQGTITFLTGGHPYEINYAGNILWQPPNFNTAFHHEFTRLNNGHYMSMIFENDAGVSHPLIKDSIPNYSYDSAGFFRSKFFSSIVEYDKSGRMVWRWSGFNYQNNSDLRLRKTVDCKQSDFELHENSFFFDEKNKVIYLGARNISRIIKIKYPEGTVLNTYGTQYKAGTVQMGNDLFCGQHCCKVDSAGYLYLFSNNLCGIVNIPTIVIMQEPAHGEGQLKKIWEYQCTIEDMDSATIKNLHFNSGGSVFELPDRSILAMMGMPYPKAFIVNHDKQIIWSAIPERYDPEIKKWKFFEQYRVSFLSRKDLEKIIWASEK